MTGFIQNFSVTNFVRFDIVPKFNRTQSRNHRGGYPKHPQKSRVTSLYSTNNSREHMGFSVSEAFRFWECYF